MGGVAADEPLIICTCVGFLPWLAFFGEVILVKTYYSSNVVETIVSPMDIVTSNLSNFNAWGQYSNIDSGTSYIEFHCYTQAVPLKFSLTASDGV